jgi:RND superfamily putative drug exporter
VDTLSPLVQHRRLVVACWAVALALLAPQALRVERVLETATRVEGSESARVEAELVSRFRAPYAHYAVLVVRGAPSPSTPSGRELIDSVASVVAAVPGVAAARGYQDASDTLLVGRASTGTFLLVGLDPAAAHPDEIVPGLRAATAGFARQEAVRFPTLELRWTGETVLNADLRQASAASARAAERRAIPLALVLLVAALGTLVAAGVPVLSGALVITLALGVAGLLSMRWPLSILLQSFVSMIGLGLGIDYALLSVTRFREALAATGRPMEAATVTVRSAGRTIRLSGLAVAVGFTPLLALPVSELRSVAVGGLLASGLAMLVAVSLLPALLAWLGHRIEGGRLWLPLASTGGRWRAWGRWVTAHPLAVLLVAGVPLGLLAWQATRMRAGLPRGDNWLPPHVESVVALRDLEQMGRGAVLQTVRVVLELPDGTNVLSPAGWSAAKRLREWLVRDPRIAGTLSFSAFDQERPISRLALFMLPTALRQSYLAADRRAVLFDAVPREEIDPRALIRLVRELRVVDPATVTGLPGARLRIGGVPALQADYDDAIGRRFLRVVGLVLGGTFVALFVGFRSVLIPLKAVLLNVLSVAAGFGVVVLVFQDGHGVGLFGLAAPLDAVFTSIPTLVFCTVFGLSMDYEVFLVAGVAEARRGGLEEHAAIAEGLARTGPVITSAAAVMVAVFTAFALGDFLVMQILGLALAASVAIDATVVRVAIGPALLALAGRWNWWPGRPGDAR